MCSCAAAKHLLGYGAQSDLKLMDHFDFHEVFKTKQATFTTIARLFVTAKRTSSAREGTVQKHHARTEFAGDTVGFFLIRCLDIGGKAIGGVIGNFDGFFFGIKRNDRDGRAKDFFTRNAHIVVHISKDRRLDEIALIGAIRLANTTNQKGCAFIDTRLNKRLDAVKLDVADERADVIALNRRVANRCFFANALDRKSVV